MGQEPEQDFFRDTWVRYLGYANEMGESFRPLVPARVVTASYAVAFAYSFADTADKARIMYNKEGAHKKVVVEAGDALIWQTLASVIIPGYAINRLCFYTLKGLSRYPKIPMLARNLTGVAVSLLSIPFIVNPIDDGVTLLMDKTYRKWISATD